MNIDRLRRLTVIWEERAGEGVLDDLRSADEALLGQRAHRLSVRVGGGERLEGGAVVPQRNRLRRIFGIINQQDCT